MARSQQKWMDHLVIVRHGESRRNVLKRLAEGKGRGSYGGGIRDMDVELTRRGERQARATGEHLRRVLHFDVVYTSPYRRTLQTTDLLLGAFPRRPEVIVEERIREKEFGLLDGLTKNGIAARFPGESERRRRQGKYYYRPPGGESYPDVNLRVHSFLGALARDCRRKAVLVVCHSVVVLSFRRLLERLTEDDLLAIDADPEQDVRNCSVTWYAFDPDAGGAGKLVLRAFNEIHYPEELASGRAAGAAAVRGPRRRTRRAP